MPSQAPKHRSLKEKAMEELKQFWIVAIYLAIFFSAFTLYRRMVLAEFGVPYLHYGTGLIEALIIAKIVLIGKALGVDKHLDRGPLILAVVFKAFLFSLLTIAFGALEHVVEGLIHRKDWATIMRDLLAARGPELFARTIMLFVSFLPFFAFWEIGNYKGRHNLVSMFFSKTRPPLPQT